MQSNLILAGFVLAALLGLSPVHAAEVQYDVQYYDVGSGDHPHDVAPAPDGTVWYTGQHKGVLGRLDPKTGKIDRVPLGEGSLPFSSSLAPNPSRRCRQPRR